MAGDARATGRKDPTQESTAHLLTVAKKWQVSASRFTLSVSPGNKDRVPF